MYKKDLALNNLQWLICQKTTNQPKVDFVDIAVIVCSNQSFFDLLCISLESLNCGIYTILDAGEFFSSFFS